MRDALPAVAIIAGTWAYAGFLGDSDGYREAWALVEAGVLSTATGEALSYAAGRSGARAAIHSRPSMQAPRLPSGPYSQDPGMTNIDGSVA